MNHNIYLIDLPLLIMIVSLVYCGTRSDDWGVIWRETLRWMVRLTFFLGVIGVVLYIVSKS